MIRKLLLGAAVLAIVGISAWWLSPWILPTLEILPGEVLYDVDTDRRAVALTLDDGPDPSTTPEILRVLRRYGARATFFVIGDRAREHDELLERIVAEGHELGNHMLRDRKTRFLGRDEMERSMQATHRILSRHGRVRWFRPGGGFYDRAILEAAEELGYRTALGSVYPFDTALPFPALLARFVLNGARSGDVIVLHDGPDRGRTTALTLELVLPELRDAGYRVVTLSDLAAGARKEATARSPARTPPPAGRR